MKRNSLAALLTLVYSAVVPVVVEAQDDSPLIGAEDLGLEFDLTDNPVDEADAADKKDNLYIA